MVRSYKMLKRLTGRVVENVARKFADKLPDIMVTHFYVIAAKDVGMLSTLTCYGFPIDIEKAVESWKVWEQEYANRGFKPIDKKTLSLRRYYGDSIADLVGQRLETGESAILHAPEYQSAIQEWKTKIK